MTTIRIRFPVAGGRRTRTLCTCTRNANGEWTIEPFNVSTRARRQAYRRAESAGAVPRGAPEHSRWWNTVYPPSHTASSPVVVIPEEDKVMFFKQGAGPAFTVGLAKLSRVLDGFAAAGRAEIEWDTLRRAIDRL